jgi:GMP synthase-like glutamine amidotransferase
MAPVMAAAGISIEVIDGEQGCTLPADAADACGMILLGGVMSANDDAACPHFPDLLALIRHFTATDRPVLGVCLGGQLVARALGGRVIERAKGEYGFIPLHGRDGVDRDPLLAGLELPAHVMQWHNDHFTVPPAASHLLESTTCAGQAFRAGRRTWGFQCHFEVDEPIVAQWSRLRAEVVDDPSVVAQTRAAAERHLAQAKSFGRAITERWLEFGRSSIGSK